MQYRKFYANEVFDLVYRLLGSVEPVGESNVDERHLDNLKEYDKLIAMLIDTIGVDALPGKNRPEYSMCVIGKEAEKYLKGYRETVDSFLEE